MNKRNVFIGIAMTAIIAVLVFQLVEVSPNSSDENIIFIKNSGIKSIKDLSKVEEIADKTVLVNMWTPDSDNCLNLTENQISKPKDLVVLHIFSSGDFNSNIGYRRFVKRKQVKGKYLLLPTNNYINLVSEISLSEKGDKAGTYPIQFFVKNGAIIEIDKNNKEYLSFFK